MNICSKCGFEVKEENDLYNLTVEFLARLKISLGAPNFKHQHIFPLDEEGKRCEGTPEVYKILGNNQDLLQPSNSNTLSRQQIWQEAYLKISNRKK